MLPPRRNCITSIVMAAAVCTGLLAIGVSRTRDAGALQTPTRPLSQPGLNVRDSAGVVVIEVAESFMSRLPVWRIGAAPTVSIGSENGEPPFLFDGIRRTAIAKLTNGSLAIVDGQSIIRGSAEIRIFDAAGRYLRTIGRKGQGPGEFASPPDIRALPNGGVLASDRGRVTKFDAMGKMIETYEVPITDCPDRCSDRGVLGNGTYAVYSSTRPPFARGEPAGKIIAGLKASYGLATKTETRVVMTLNLPPHKVLVRPPRVNDNGSTLPGATLILSPVLTPSPESRITAGQDHFAVSRPDAYEFRIYNSSARLLRIIRVQRPRVRVTEAEKRALIATADASLPIPGRVVSDFWPDFDYVRFGDNDDLWVQDYHRTTGNDTGPVRYTIFGNDGVPIARLDARTDPIVGGQSRTSPHQVTSSRTEYRTITVDSLGVNRVLIFAIVRS